MVDHVDLRRLAMAATPGPYNVYAETVATKDDAIAECAYQVHHTDPFVGKVYMLSASGKCPAVTGCGPTSEANARFFAATDPQTVIGLLDRMEALETENARLTKIVNGCDWYWPENDTSSDACANSPWEIAETYDLQPADVLAYSRGGVIEIRYFAFLPPADDSDSDDNFEVDEASEDAATAKIQAEIARRSALSGKEGQ